MMELRYDDRSSSSSAFRARNSSPDSVIFTRESNFSLFSSASASVDRCSFTSDAHDNDSEISPHLAGQEREVSTGNPDRNRNKPVLHSRSRLYGKGDKAKAHKVDSDSDVEDDKHVSDSARNSFSLALRDCQERRSRFDDPSRKSDRRRTASFDFNNATACASSPRLGSIKKSSMTARRSDAFPSPGTPNYRSATNGLQKGWSSERVPLQSIAGRRNLGTAMLPFNANGRTLPSKWEDAERWIFSPVSGDAGGRTSVPAHQRRPKSKSGPLGPPGVGYYSQYSPAIRSFEVPNMGNFTTGSPVSAANGLTVQSSGYHRGGFPIHQEPFIGRSVSIHGCSEIGPQDEKLGNGVEDAATDSRAVSRRDMSTQMSPDESACSSLETKHSFTAYLESRPSCKSIVELHAAAYPSPMLGVKDVQVDKQVTLTRQSKKSRFGIRGRKSNLDTVSSARNRTSSISKAMREEARITAWENLQKAKAEAEIRKLEVKLEKKRSSSMDKIMKKLRSAQKKAQDMRSSVLANQSHQTVTASSDAIVLRRTRQIRSLSGCFTCHAF